jgi:methionine-rich copper-binding protein CopC
MNTSSRLLVRGTFAALTALAFLAPTTAAAHGSTSSNLDQQVFEIAPERAEFVYSGDVERSTAQASLRYLGVEDLSAEDYFRFDVPTTELARSEPLDGTGPEFAFVLPRLAAGSYAIDWEVTPVDDHTDSSVTFFQVTVGVTDPDPVPPVSTEGSGDVAPEDNDAQVPLDSAMGEDTTSSASQGWDRTRWLGLAGAIVLVSLLTTFYIIRDRDK